jgi:multicomponent Na+:H+ antiporter subunit A
VRITQLVRISFHDITGCHLPETVGALTPGEDRHRIMMIVLTLGILAALVVLTPVITAAFGRQSGWPLGAGYLAATAAFLSPTAEVLAGRTPEWSIPWIPSLGVELAFQVDGTGVVFTLIALLIGAVVLFYSTGYLEPGRNLSFYWLMAMFTFSMAALVLTSDLLVLFVCWELTSLASFMLIARSGEAAHAPSMRTLFITFIGGLSLLVAVGFIIARTGTTDIHTALASEVWGTDPGFTAALAVLVAIAAMTKSAQFPFHSWLPDAMAAATPVSAYLHAAAVVKAGIFLLIRFSPAFHSTPVWNTLLIVAGLLTTALGGWFALNQPDLKKLMAYSTVSQLGLIVAAIGVGSELALAAAVLHIIAHALFKSGLFMMVGVVDHIAHTRIFGQIPQLYRVAPVSFIVTLIGAASMAGIPPLLGFASKETIFMALGEAPGAAWAGWAALIAAAAASVLTFAYCAKVVFGAFVDGAEPDRAQLGRENPVMVAFAALPILVSVPLAFMLPQLETLVVAAVRAALPGSDPHPHLALWHGLTPELIASILIIAAGILIVLVRKKVWRFFMRATLPFNGADVMNGLVRGLETLGGRASGLVAPVRAAPHARAILALLSLVIFGGSIAIWVGPGLPAVQPNLSRPIDGALLLLITASVLVVCFSRSRISATVALSAVGILAVVQIMALGAPDVTLTQLLVEAMTIIVIMLVLQKMPRTFWRYRKRTQIRRGIFASVVGIAVGLAVWVMTGRRERSDLALYYLNEAPEISGGANIVNTILVEFRALDTLGELTVLGMAGIAIIAVLSSVRDKFIDPPASEIPEVPRTPWLGLRPRGSVAHRAVMEAWPNVIPMQLMVRVLGPILAVASVLIFWRGHNEPGGGFIAALVGAAIIGLMYMSTSTDRAIGPPRAPLYLIGGGVLIAVLTGVLGLVAAGSFLEPMHGYILGQHFTTSMIFDVGVYLAVLGLILASFNLLGTSDSAFTPAGDDVLTEGQMHRDVDSAPFESTRERVDEISYGELDGPLDSTRGEGPTANRITAVLPRRRLSLNSTHISTGQQHQERGE